MINLDSIDKAYTAAFGIWQTLITISYTEHSYFVILLFPTESSVDVHTSRF